MENRNYYFTFGQNHINNKGEFLKDYYVKVVEENYTTARTKFQAWANKNLASPDYWSSQYPESDFNFNFFPKGELITL